MLTVTKTVRAQNLYEYSIRGAWLHNRIADVVTGEWNECLLRNFSRLVVEYFVLALNFQRVRNFSRRARFQYLEESRATEISISRVEKL